MLLNLCGQIRFLSSERSENHETPISDSRSHWNRVRAAGVNEHRARSTARAGPITGPRTHVPDFAKLSDQDIYGSEVMTAQERNQYRKQLQDATNAEERNRVEAQHREMVQTRAKARNVDLAPPGQGIYGGALMSVEERSRYREQLRMIESDTEKAKFMAQHREEMQMRAQAQGVDPVELKETEEAE
mgnify:CR=1 FL=1